MGMEKIQIEHQGVKILANMGQADVTAKALEELALDFAAGRPLDTTKVNNSLLRVVEDGRPGTLLCAVKGWNTAHYEKDKTIPGLELEGVSGTKFGALVVNVHIQNLNGKDIKAPIYTYPVTPKEAKVIPEYVCNVGPNTSETGRSGAPGTSTADQLADKPPVPQSGK